MFRAEGRAQILQETFGALNDNEPKIHLARHATLLGCASFDEGGVLEVTRFSIGRKPILNAGEYPVVGFVAVRHNIAPVAAAVLTVEDEGVIGAVNCEPSIEAIRRSGHGLVAISTQRDDWPQALRGNPRALDDIHW